MEIHGIDSMIGGWGILGMIAWLISLFFLTGFVALILIATRFLSVRRGAGRTDSAENILRERFARGEISAEECEKSMDVLRENPPHKGYEAYIREAMSRLRFRRGTNS